MEDILDEDLDAFLEHHGVKGMHWGVRKSRPTGSKNVILKVEQGPTHHPLSKKELGGTAAASLGAAFIGRLAFKLNAPASAAIGLGTAATITALIDKHKNKKLSEI